MKAQKIESVSPETLYHRIMKLPRRVRREAWTGAESLETLGRELGALQPWEKFVPPRRRGLNADIDLDCARCGGNRLISLLDGTNRPGCFCTCETTATCDVEATR